MGRSYSLGAQKWFVVMELRLEQKREVPYALVPYDKAALWSFASVFTARKLTKLLARRVASSAAPQYRLDTRELPLSNLKEKENGSRLLLFDKF